MKKILLIAWVFAAIGAHAQSTVNASGGSKTIGANTFEWSVAEMTVTGTYASPTLVLTQGVLQPKAPSTGIGTTMANKNDVQVFPNPVQNELYLQCNFGKGGKMQYTLQNIAGTTLLMQEAQLATGKEKLAIDFKGIAAGNYILQVYYMQPEGNTTASFKVAKTQ